MISFSLVLGTLERTRDLKDHLASLDAQTYKNFELIVVGQNKDERLASILAAYADKFPILHLRSELGLTHAKSLGLKYVTGDIIGFPDDNCQFPQDLLERVASFFAEHPRIDGLTGHSVDENGKDSNGKFDVSEDEARDVIAGFVCVLDMTAEDILRRNPRYLTRSKSFDTFFSFGPHLITPDEVGEISTLEVATVLNGEVRRSNTVSNMIFSPLHLVAFHSRVMTLLPGNIISTGTPGTIPLQDGDVLECRIDGFEPLSNPVIE